MFCDITLYELKKKEVKGEMAIQKRWNINQIKVVLLFVI